MAATLTQIVVSLLVGAAMFWVIRNAYLPVDYRAISKAIAWFDLTISSLIAFSVFLMGQAVTYYEIFTGESMPRQGMARYWRRAVILSVGFAVVMAGSLELGASPIYVVLLSGLLMVLFFALLSWRSFQEREVYVKSLRPFVSGQGVLERFISQPNMDVDSYSLFEALSSNVLGLQKAVLLPLGSIAALIDEPFVYPMGSEVSQLPAVEDILESPEQIGVPLHRATNGEWVWAVPLWSARGLIGVLYLGPKMDGGLYSQEEIDIARTTGERLIDTHASAVMAQRLMSLQRQQMAEGQILDRYTRRVLHDEVLPQLHAAMLALSSGGEVNSAALQDLSQVHQQVAELLRQSPTLATPQVAELGVLAALRSAVEDELRGAFDEVNWQVSESVEKKCLALPVVSAEVIYYAAREAIRNAAQHGRVSNRPLTLRIATNKIADDQLIIEDNGVGFKSSTDQPGGHGLSLHSTMMALIGGSLHIDSKPGQYTRAVLTLP